MLEKRLNPDRFVHSLNVADCARYLAEKYGEDKDKAYLAGLLHDVMKNTPGCEQLSIIERDNVKLTPCESANPKLWHAISGASFLKNELGIKDAEFLNAVRYHTTGRAGMSRFEKIIYIADFNSADRDYKDADTMRELAEESLESAMLFALKYSIARLAQTGRTIHTDSVNCYNELIINLKSREDMYGAERTGQGNSKVLDEKKGLTSRLLKPQRLNSFGLLCSASGTSNTHVKSLADDVEYEIQKRFR
jgi:nicotinate-nucleotide adenylyltransferase